MTTRWWGQFVGHAFVNTPNNNGIGRFVQQLQRVTFKFCKSSGPSKGVRDFIEKDLIHFARRNPGVVVYLKPRRHRAPAIVAEYLNGEREYMSFYNKHVDEIIKWVEYQTERSGRPTKHVMQYWHTDLPSIQGTWTPWVNRNPELFLNKYPNMEEGAAEKIEKTGTDQVLELQEIMKNMNIESHVVSEEVAHDRIKFQDKSNS